MDLRTIKPKTLEEAAQFIVDNLSEDDKKYIKEHTASSAHHGFGTALRNEWGLWTGSDLKEHFKSQYGLGHADDMSGLILSLVDSKLSGKPFNIQNEVKHYKNHWKKCGVDPLTQKKV